MATMLARAARRLTRRSLSSSAAAATVVEGAHLPLSLTEDEAMFKEAVAGFAASEIAPLVKAMDAKSELDAGLLGKLFENGFMGVEVEERFGGSGASFTAMCCVIEELAKVDPAVSTCVDVHSTVVNNTLNFWGGEDLKARYLPRLASEIVGSFCLSEPGSGSDVVSMSLRATDDGDDYILNGNKMWITNGPGADVLVVYATVDPALGTKGITAFLIEKGMTGFSTGNKLDKMGMRGSDTAELIFEDCRVSKSQILGKVGQGVSILMSGLDYERVVLAGGALGLSRAALDVAMPYVHERQQFGRPIGEFQLMQAKIADMYTETNAARAYVYSVAAACDADRTTRVDAAGCILYAAERATQHALQAVQALGGNGYINDYPAARLLRDAKLYEIGAGTSEIRRMLIGRELFDATRS